MFRRLLLVVALAVTMSGVSLQTEGFVRAAAVSVAGNDTAPRTYVDTWFDFTIVDTNHPVTHAGTITSFAYYAANTNTFSFVVVNSANAVTYISPLITPAAIGVNTYMPSSPITVNTGDNVGLYFRGNGTVPFDFGGAPAWFTLYGSGQPSVGQTLSYVGSSPRTYSFVAYGTLTPTSKEECKQGGYVQYSDPATSQPFRNQGQCVSWVENNIIR